MANTGLTLVIAHIIYVLEKRDCLWGLLWTSVWRNTLQSGYSKERESGVNTRWETVDGRDAITHTARWSRKITRVPSVWKQTCLLGLFPGSIPGLGPINIARFSPSSVWTKARTNAVKADDARYHATLSPGVLKAGQCSQRNMYKLYWSRDQGAPHYPRWSWNPSPV